LLSVFVLIDFLNDGKREEQEEEEEHTE